MAKKKPTSPRKKGMLPSSGKKPLPAESVYQFKITLIDTRPPIWRRIQVEDCTVDTLHEHIQKAMGWTNSHLHDFKIGDQLYGNPMLMEENFEEMGYGDSTAMMLSDIVTMGGKRFRLLYQYDFGDSWKHEVLFEGCLKAEAGRQYPLCLQGERACPPEDVGGVPGYANFLEAIGNPKHDQHDEMLEWAGERFDPEAFDPVKAMKAMKGVRPDWRPG
jgi:hypothetical protein